jgi:hypothetical protein
MSHDYLPKNDEELLIFTDNFYAYAATPLPLSPEAETP